MESACGFECPHLCWSDLVISGFASSQRALEPRNTSSVAPLDYGNTGMKRFEGQKTVFAFMSKTNPGQ
jgi:hypothetical protein